MGKRQAAVFAIVAVPLALGINYLLALASHPSSYWLFHTVLGLL